MIRYALICDRGHGFEAWFRNAGAYDAQAAAGEVSCPLCGTSSVSKRLMAPAVGGGRREPDAAPEATATHALARDPKAKALAEAMARLRRHVVENADYVGDRFAEEARRIHHEETERRSIYGEANPADVRSLLEDGIEVHPLPPAPEDTN